MCAENGNLMAIAQQLVQQQQQQQQQIFPNPSGYFNGGSMSMSMGGVNMNMNMSPWLSAPTAWQHDGLMSFPPGICTDVVGDLCSTTTNSYLSEPNSVLDLSRASMLFSPMEQFQDFTQHLHDGTGAKQMPLLGGVEPPAPAFKDNALYHHEALIKKERPPIKEPGVGDGSSAALRSSVFRSPELQTFGFESPVSNRNDFVSPDVCTEWMDCLMSDLSPEAIAGNGNAAIASCFDSSNPCESTESSELPNGGSGYRRHSSEDAAAWQSEFGILGEAFKRSSPTSWTPDTTTEQLLCSSPSADLLSAASSELLSTNSLKGKAALQEQYSGAAGGGHEFQTLHHRVPNVHQSVCPPMQQLIREPSTPPQKRQQGQQQQDPLKGKREEDSPKPEIDALDRHMQGQRSDLLHSLLDCAKIVDTEPERAGKSVAYLQGIASHHGDPTQRIVSHFAAALAKRLAKGIKQKPQFQSSDECSKSFEDLTLAYKALNDACPYSKFAQLTGNQAILEAMDKAEKIHIVDFGIVQGVQWAALLHAFATRPGGKPRKIKITGIPAPTLGQNPTSSLLATGKRLTEFAKLLDLEFEFCAVSKHMSEVELSTLKIEQDECIAVNFMLQLYNLLGDSPEPLVKILKLAHALSPKVVTLGEYEAHLNACHFPVRFRNALEYFSAFFDSMEPNMARDSAERLNVEKLFFAEKIMGIVAFEGAERKIRLEGRDQWRILMESAGFKFTNLSHYARSQARILLYNYCEAYSLDESSPGFLSLAWQNRPLLTVSAWCCC